MARTKSGGFNKFLNFIGLVDDAEPSYENEYASENYGRASTYVPQRQRANARPTQSAPAPRRSSAPSRSARTYGDDRGYSERSYSASSRYSDRYDDRSARADDGYADEPRPARRAAYDDGYAAEAPRASRTERPRSRFEEEPARRVERTEAPVPVQRTRISRPQRTVMFSLHRLEDCCEVIDNLIRGNTIVLTMDELDGHLMQRAVDTLSGAVFALHATIRKASDKTYLIAPSGVEVNETYDVDRRF